jgi:sphingomyelin phosphodiesterase acid-like 3
MIPTMRVSYRSPILSLVALACLLVESAQMPAVSAQAAQTGPAQKPHAANSAKAVPSTIPALFVSDIHFDPFHDPAKAKELAAAPATQWRSILSAPDSANQAEAFAGLQQACSARGVDTPFALLRSSLQAMRAHLPGAKFITVSGDLVVHGFPCRFQKLFPGSAPGDYQAFVVKTMTFVMDELTASFPGTPIYVALGNNDSGCGDYQLDAGGDFLAQASIVLSEGLPAAQREDELKQFGAGGYFSVTMAEPMHNTRLIVVNDLFLSPKYSTCAGKPDPSAGADEMVWLERQLQDARQAGQNVWVMGHIPPGVDPYSTVAKFRDVCGKESPVMYLSSDKMADLMVQFADVVRLGIFGHTHMDEMRLLEPEGGDAESAAGHRVAVKLVPSISPVDGNKPAFTIARVNQSTANLENYDVIEASDRSGVRTSWTAEYDFARTYHEADFSPSTLKKLVDKFNTDHYAGQPESVAYVHDYFVGDMSPELSPFWPEYVCAMGNYAAKSFAACVCSTAK